MLIRILDPFEKYPPAYRELLREMDATLWDEVPDLPERRFIPELEASKRAILKRKVSC